MTRIVKAAAVAILTASLAIAGVPFASGGAQVVKPASTGCCTM